uniref:Reverse transcriptase domain-containing protein n=1 Tax=Tanacetum cinerariifolium TaxID=118510 RepID=A0A6L2L2C2_TANCI|nr:hypothetical protein [Tanacetum cinerariifolium]
MSDSEHSTVTYTSISDDYEEPSDVGSLRVMVYGYDGLPMHPPFLDYMHGPKHPPLPVYVPYVSASAYPEFMPPKDDVFPDPEEEDDEDPKEDPADYPTNRDDDEEEEESSRDDADDEEEDEGEDKKEEEGEHLALAVFIPPSAYRTTIRMYIPSLLFPVPSPLTSYSSPLPQIPSSPLPTIPTDAGGPLGYRAAMIQLRAESPSTSHPLSLPPPIVLPHTKASMVMIRAAAPSTYILAPRSGILPSETPPSRTLPLLPIPLPTSSPPLLLPSTDCRADITEVTLPPQKRLCIALGLRYEIEESSFAPTTRPTGGFRVDYGFVGTLNAEIRRDPDREIGYGTTDVWVDLEEIPVTDMVELGQRMTDFVTTVRDRRSHARTTRFIESEARASCEACIQSMDANDTARSEVRALQTTVLAQQTEIGDLRAADHTIFSYDLKKMAPTKRTTRASIATTTTTIPVTNAQLKALIDQGIADALAARDVNKSQNGDDIHNLGTGSRRTERAARECTYTNFLEFKNHVKFATCTLHGVALTWWKSHVKIVCQDAAYGMPWNTLMKMMTAKRMFPEEPDKIEKMQIEFATELMNKKIRTFTECHAENKRKFEDTSRNNQNQQQQKKRQNTGRAYTARPGRINYPRLSFHITFAMSTQQDIYAAGSESRPHMLNKENYVPWSPCLLRYAKSRPNGKLIHNSIINGQYVRRMIPEPCDTNREVPVNETFHVRIDDELTEKELKQIEADDQAIRTILLGLPEDIYAAVDSCETTQEI